MHWTPIAPRFISVFKVPNQAVPLVIKSFECVTVTIHPVETVKKRHYLVIRKATQPVEI